ncbi:hypothetical protein ACMFMG_011554 [Clarireedia jacksonii]
MRTLSCIARYLYTSNLTKSINAGPQRLFKMISGSTYGETVPKLELSNIETTSSQASKTSTSGVVEATRSISGTNGRTVARSPDSALNQKQSKDRDIVHNLTVGDIVIGPLHEPAIPKKPRRRKTSARSSLKESGRPIVRPYKFWSIYSKWRRFIVAQARPNSCVLIPIYTNEDTGLKKIKKEYRYQYTRIREAANKGKITEKVNDSNTAHNKTTDKADEEENILYCNTEDGDHMSERAYAFMAYPVSRKYFADYNKVSRLDEESIPKFWNRYRYLCGGSQTPVEEK